MLQQVKEELKSYRHDLQNLENRKYQCAFNSFAFIVHTGFKYNQLHVTGHSACIDSTTIVDPTVGCAWFYSGCPVSRIKSILLNKIPPDVKTDWFTEGSLRFWWDYDFKLLENKKQNTLTDDWDVPIEVVILRATFKGVEFKSIGKFSDYVRNV